MITVTIRNMAEFQTVLMEGHKIFYTTARDETRKLHIVLDAAIGETSGSWLPDDKTKVKAFWINLDRGNLPTIPQTVWFGYSDTVLFYTPDLESERELERRARLGIDGHRMFPELSDAWKALQEGNMTSHQFAEVRDKL